MSTQKPQSDPELIRRVQKGDRTALEQLIRENQETVFRFLFHFVGSSADAEDLTQETFIMVFRKIHQHHPGQSFAGWLLTIARNLAVSSFRRKKPSPLDPTLVAAAMKEVTPGPEDGLMLLESSSEVHAAIHMLPEGHRETVILHYLLDIPLQKVAELLNIPEGTAKSRLFKARGELRRLLEAGEKQ